MKYVLELFDDKGNDLEKFHSDSPFPALHKGDNLSTEGGNSPGFPILAVRHAVKGDSWKTFITLDMSPEGYAKANN